MLAARRCEMMMTELSQQTRHHQALQVAEGSLELASLGASVLPR